MLRRSIRLTAALLAGAAAPLPVLQRAGIPAAALPLAAQAPISGPPFLSRLTATRADPVYTTYAAALQRSRFLLDEGYHLRFDDPGRPIELTTQAAGDWGVGFLLDGRWVAAVKDLAAEPVITVSYGDVVRYHYRPFPGIRVDATFLVHSSRVAVEELRLTNDSRASARVQVIRWLVNRRRAVTPLTAGPGAVRFRHVEPPDDWMKEHAIPHVSDVQDVLLFAPRPDAIDPVADTTSYAASAPEVLETIDDRPRLSRRLEPDTTGGYLAARTFLLAPGASARWRMARAVAPVDSDMAATLAEGRRLLTEPLDVYIRADERLYRRVPPPPTDDPAKQLLYWGAFTLLRQSMLPPEGASRFPYYVFSREPQWGWGHGGQVFHESLSMLAYALMDPAGAMASERLFAARQHPDGYIPYRVGPYLEETIPYRGQLTTSAPWYAWESWEIYRITRDAAFLRDMYGSASRFYDWLAAHRDTDGDGLYEWGGHAVLESVRDGGVAVWDQVGWPAQFEALDLNAMMVSEASALDSMALALARPQEAARWGERAATLRRKIESTFWDDSTGFYYHVDLKRRGFTHEKPDDLKRREIIGFLPLWAGTASPARAARLIATLTDPRRFWRPGGVPSLAADDPYYDPRGYWNGPVWVAWNYLVERGLLRYGRAELARELVDRVADGMIAQLRETHVFLEMYGPDGDWAGHHQVYIWAGLIARMMLDAGATPASQRSGLIPRARGTRATAASASGPRARSREAAGDLRSPGGRSPQP